MNLKKYGHFSKDGKEFIITNPATPRPWINYLTNEEYCAVISQNAGGYSFYKDCRTDRILRWLPGNWHFDRPGRYIYMRDKKSKKCWSASYQPLRVKPSFYEARHGLGYTITNTTYNGINIQITFFVPVKETCEIWLVKITNKSNKTRHLEAFPYVEWLLGDYHQELRYRNIMNLYNRIWYDKAHKAIFAKKTACWGAMSIKPYMHIDFFTTSLSVSGYVTQKDAFLGKNNTEEKPEMVLTGKFRNFASTSGEDGIACFKNNVTLKPNQQKEFTVILGQAPAKGKSLSKILAKYRKVKEAKKELNAVRALWHERIVENIEVETPDKDFDLMVNTWVKYQLYICNFWSRSPSYYHEGAGGRGYRDSCQDADSIMSINSGHARKKILKIASLIRRDGTSAPGWADTTGPAKHRPNKDHQIWLTATVASYIKETGDKEILHEYMPYLKDRWINGWDVDTSHKGLSRTDGEGTLFEHLEKNLNFTFDDVGPHGLPLIGHADWNDAIDAAGIKLCGESTWLAQALVRSLKMMAELSQLAGESKKCDEFLHKAHTMTDRINSICWDGNWYIRGFTDEGSVYGAKNNKEGKIYINSQSWAILSGVADKQKQNKILKSVDKYLDGPHGIALFYPAYSSWNQGLGRISMFSEGTKENAAVFCHAATFHVVAECMAGRGTKAYTAIKKLMPNAQQNYDLYKTEPYAYAEYLVGPQHPYLYGEGAFTWVTGTSGWQFMAATEWLLGIRRDYDGLRIDPCIPKKWKKFKVKRPFRNAIYEITILNPKAKEKGIKEIWVDGERIDGTLIYPHSDGKIHKVKAIMG